MPNTLTMPAPAKLNRFLHITGRRPDGYHELQTLFQMLDWSDQLTFTPTSQPGLLFHCSDPALETDDNLVARAYRLICEQVDQELPVSIHLQKFLPMGGGLGGGSSDAASTLLGLNQLFNLNLDQPTLERLGRTLGADVPVFVRGQTAWAEGIGDKLTPIALDELWHIIVHPNVHVSTATLFSHPELTRDTPVSTIQPELAIHGHNDFEPLVRRLYPQIDQAFECCQDYGNARLTGTGACLFMTMPDQASAENVRHSIQDRLPDANVYAVRGRNLSPAHQHLSAGRA
ncbi:4-(cytidine 5'-diphospho)-2-C-methyl-D-erythritol kinase [Reinekea blandensis]|uniref:4-diphosphocytidyl-2-C-methyl-D-erythritol kinase n=1 Tax=Reinekea blandensis MED297 TaxID=314283 RepID=A4BI72_9GAMM|nr:4-(cytidine 5'-diphospho)-2-C-methyl-D-erythritol kinase [Reinekea blandensis]EAR08215.1 4-diphosphocytidyl-2C-methyl-D-erythritol kinase [Reinekea sp. MED297] [Reinekea blandensis MED297]